jgi:hypothetical protein
MALSNYTELKSTIASFLNRDDLTSVIPTFILLAESQINRDVRHWQMESRSSGQQTGGDQYSQLPADWIETIRLTLASGNKAPLQFISIADMASRRSSVNDAAGTPAYFSHVQGQIEMFPTPSQDTDIELLYYAKVPALETNTTNWLLTEAPDVYLYGALLHSAPYLHDDARLAVWAQLYSAAVARINQSSDASKFSGTGLKMKIRGLS